MRSRHLSQGIVAGCCIANIAVFIISLETLVHLSDHKNDCNFLILLSLISCGNCLGCSSAGAVTTAGVIPGVGSLVVSFVNNV